MNFILQCGVLFTFLALGELIVWLTGIAVPSSIPGMLLLTLSLKLRIVRLRHVDRIADFRPIISDSSSFLPESGLSAALILSPANGFP